MNTLSASDAAQLMVGINPETPASHINPGHLAYAKKIFKLAANQNKPPAPIFKWLEWANSIGFKIHPIFALKAIESTMSPK